MGLDYYGPEDRTADMPWPEEPWCLNCDRDGHTWRTCPERDLEGEDG